jgi:hypothetical protein
MALSRRFSYIVQEPTTKRCRIVEERPASPSVGVVIGGVGFGVRTQAEMPSVQAFFTIRKCEEFFFQAKVLLTGFR